KWIFELSELAAISRTDAKKLKAFVTRGEERGRDAYAFFPTGQKRSCVFAGTFNPDEDTKESEYLNRGDRRRWWTIPVGVVGPIDLQALLRDRDQLFAEAFERALLSDVIDVPRTWEWHSLVLPERFRAEATERQIARQTKDPFNDLLAPLFNKLKRQRGT